MRISISRLITLSLLLVVLANPLAAQARDNLFSTIWTQTVQAFEYSWRSLRQWANSVYERGEESIAQGMESARENADDAPVLGHGKREEESEEEGAEGNSAQE